MEPDQRRRFVWTFAVLSGLVFAAAVGIQFLVVYRSVSREDMDLTPLQERSKDAHYRAMYAVVQANEIPEQGFAFVVLGGTRSNINKARILLGRAVKEHPAFILHTGGLVRQGQVDEYVAHHFRLLDAVAPVPVIPVPGRSEAGPNADFMPFAALYGGTRFSFDYGGCRFVGVNNADESLSSQDLEFLERELTKPDVTHRFVVLGVPPLFMKAAAEANSTGEPEGFRWNAGEFRSLATETKVDVVFVGHVHGFATEVIDGVRYTLTGGGGADVGEVLGEEQGAYNYVLVRVTPEGIAQEAVQFTDGTWTRTPID